MCEEERVYLPKISVPGEIMRLIMEIAAALERYQIVMEGPDGVRLRKQNHIRTIRGTTAIEGNTLTEDQITAVLAGKRVNREHRLGASGGVLRGDSRRRGEWFRLCAVRRVYARQDSENAQGKGRILRDEK